VTGSAGMQQPLATAAQRLARQLLDRLVGIEEILAQQLQHSESSRKNFLGSGTVPGGGTIGTVAAPLLAANLNRRGVVIQNIGAAGNLTLGLGITQPSPGVGLTLLPGQSWNGLISGAVWLGSVSIVGSAAGVTYSWVEA
jgi:hypothetical protein